MNARWVKTGLLVLIVKCLLPDTSSAVEPAQDMVSMGYNFYDGGGVTVQGPAVIVQKKLKNRLSLKASSRLDLVSSASVDAVTQASRFREDRKENALGVNFLKDDILVGIGYIHSLESDYTSNTLSASLDHDLLDKNVTLHFRFGRSWDEVGKNGDPSFGWKNLDRTVFTAGFSQILSPQWLIQFNYEMTADSGFINSPYRSVLTLDGGTFPENYPESRTGHAWLTRTTYGFFPDSKDAGGSDPKSSIQLDYRYYDDTFGMNSHTGKILFQHYWRSNRIAGFYYQYYRQGDANFYGDRLPSTQLYKARDRDLSRFSDHWIGGSLKVKPRDWPGKWLKNPFMEFGYSFVIFNYDNFTDPRTGKLYEQESHVLHTSVGFNY